jgi:hypothetical protein
MQLNWIFRATKQAIHKTDCFIDCLFVGLIDFYRMDSYSMEELGDQQRPNFFNLPGAQESVPR